jgi:trehalose 6-phosphate phosphatase
VRTLAATVPELLVEDKGMSLAVHYRRAPALADGVRRALRECLDGRSDAFVLQEGRMVLEIRPSGHDKGTAIRTFMTEVPFRGRVPIFVGDDATDEHGFAVVNELGGHSVKVGAGPSRARWHLADVAAVRRWIERSVAIPGRPTESP